MSGAEREAGFARGETVLPAAGTECGDCALADVLFELNVAAEAISETRELIGRVTEEAQSAISEFAAADDAVVQADLNDPCGSEAAAARIEYGEALAHLERLAASYAAQSGGYEIAQP